MKLKPILKILLISFCLIQSHFADGQSQKKCDHSVDSKDLSQNSEAGILQSLKVMTYNIHHANPPAQPDKIDIQHIVDIIKEQDPDLIALQEIDVKTERTGPVNEAKEIAKQLDMNYFFGKAINYEGGEYGVAILSKFPMSDQKIDKLPTVEETHGEPRTLTSVKISLPSGKNIIFGCTHLDAQHADTNRLLQIQKVVSLAKEWKEPAIIAGDFNDIPDSKVIQILDNYFQRTCSDCPFTIPADDPEKTIDFIAFHPSERFSVSRHTVLNEATASDHRPVVAEINFLKKD